MNRILLLSKLGLLEPLVRLARWAENPAPAPAPAPKRRSQRPAAAVRPVGYDSPARSR